MHTELREAMGLTSKLNNVALQNVNQQLQR